MLVYGVEPTSALAALAIGAHPDDVEISMGGTLALLTDRGYRVGVIDLTRGETGSRGTPEQRLEESRAAAGLLGVESRFNLALPDGELAVTPEAVRALTRLVRLCRPAFVFTHSGHDPHPDHAAARQLVHTACHHAGLGRFDPGLAPHRPKYVFHFTHPHRARPSFLVDISAFWETKLRAIRCHQSQVSPRGAEEPDTYLGQSHFLQILESHAISLGAQVGARYVEAFLSHGPLLVDDPLAAFGRKEGRLL
mgnify:CR=1 FL=1